jgi:ABC-2 type transport system permease protein
MFGWLEVARATFIRDLLTASSYRTGFALSALGALFNILGVFFLSRAFGAATAEPMERYGDQYFGFAVIGVAFTSFMAVGLTGVASRIREGQMMGTLELMLLSPNRLGTLLISSTLWNLAFATVALTLHLLAGVLLGMDLSRANLPAAGLSLIVAMVAFTGLGLISASIVIVIKQGNPVSLLVGMASVLLAGVLYPTSVLPDWLQTIGMVLPLTHALELLRRSMLDGEGIATLAAPLAWLVTLSVIYVPIGLWACGRAVHIAQTDGSLSEY